MQKVILASVLLATFLIPASLATTGSVRYGSFLVRMCTFTAAYVALLLFVYPRLF